MVVNINNLEIDCYGYWQEVSKFCEAKGSSYGKLKTVIPELNYCGHYSSLEELEIDGRHYNIILWSGAGVDEDMQGIPYIEYSYVDDSDKPGLKETIKIKLSNDKTIEAILIHNCNNSFKII